MNRPDAGFSPALSQLLTFLHRDCGLDRNALLQLVDYVARQLDAVGEVASDRTVIVEVFADAIGDPRMVVHSSFGGRVNGAWGVVLAGAIRERLGVEAQVISSDDGILLRFANAAVSPPADVVQSITSREARERLLADLPNSATFGAQFRMNAARALLLPRERAGKRTPLWLSRLRAKDLLQAVQHFGDFPILLETYRDCLRDVMDLDGLTDVLDRINRGEIDVLVYDAAVPSPMALGLDYRFAMQYVYEYDAPRGERQLATLSLNRALLADLLRDGTLADLLKPEAIAEVATRASRTAASERVRDVEELAQLLFDLGDLSDDEIRLRSASADAGRWIDALSASGRALRWTFGGTLRWIHAERRADYERLAVEPAPVLRRFLAHAGPTSAADLAARYGLAPSAIQDALTGLERDVASGQFAPGSGEQWIDRRNLEQIHRRTLAILRKEVQPVSMYAYAEFLRRWQGIDVSELTGSIEAEDPASETGLNRVLQQLRGLAVPGIIWERDVLSARIPDFDPAALAARCQSGDLMWVAEGGKDPRRARVRFFFRGEGGIFLDRRPSESALTDLTDSARAVHEYLADEGAALLVDVAEGAGLNRADAQSALVELVLAGLVTNDSLEALRTLLGYEPPTLARRKPLSSLEEQLATLVPNRRGPPSRHRMREARRHARDVVAAEARVRQTAWVGRWSLVHRPSLLGKPQTDEELTLRRARQLLSRWGVVTRACLERESPVFDWAMLLETLGQLETRGEVRRGYFVDGLPGIQFALPNVVERLRAANRERSEAGSASGPLSSPGEEPVLVLSAADPAQLFGADTFGGPLRFARVPSTAVALVAGEPVAALEDSGASALATRDHPSLVQALRSLARWWKPRAGGRIRLERWNGEPVLESDGVALLEAAGFVRDYPSMLWVG